MKNFVMIVAFISVALGRIAPSSAASIEVRDVWSRPGSDATVLYATITNESRHADSLDRIVTPIAGDATLHESVQSMMPSDMPGMNAMPVTSMKTLRAIQVPAGRTIRLEPGGYHVMLGDMHKGLKTGQTFVVKFHFVRAGWRAATAHVR